MDLAAADRAHLWHPFTQQRGWCDEEPLIVERAEGTDLIDTEGRRYIDGVSSLWCNVHGHRHPRIDAAVRDQLDRVAHSTMLGLSHPPAIELARRLVEIAPPGLTRVFYSDSGSTATEIALKMAFQYWRQARRGAAHPLRLPARRLPRRHDRLGVRRRHRPLPLALPPAAVRHRSRPSPATSTTMERLLAEHAGEVAAVIMEPLVQGAAGMLVHPDGYLRGVRELCDRHDVLLILDEVATGFGRTGRMFACEHEDVAPDLLCLAKGITGGYLPLAATLTTERVYEGFLGEFEELRTFFHGHTYTGNPLACAAALASLDVFEEERTLERLQPKIELLGELLEPLAAHPAVAEVRRRGFMTGIELRELPARAADGPPGHARGAPARRDRAPARRRGGADAAAVDLRGRPDAARGDHRRGDRGGHRGRGARTRGLARVQARRR